MTDRHDSKGTHLTVDEAAARLGVSRLRVREAAARGMLPSRRDNAGHLRIDLPDRGALLSGGADLEPGAIMAFLFDDIEELEATLADRDATIARLADLLDRQDVALARSGAALDAADGREARMSDLLERALTHLEGQGRMTDVTEAALTRLEQTTARLDLSLAQSDQLDALLSRAMSLAERGEKAEQSADQALTLLERALAQAEGAQTANRASEAMLDRALRAGESLRADVDAQQNQLKQQEKSIEAALALSERAAALAERDKPERRGFWRRLFGV